ncbi:branched-chain amino acid ABC transporter permease [Parablautia sp. Marseille-Q6255]|uniref:branched-chain amino acid ABC transporter permease n=1 Tax=Parablautia sp. Marseille-Q6255 TaxID=3039593 RepID=UPI0024BC5A87|nr:branched-chain amino acid ABC transporter permease [Parablautia sp. Marseille-Q6255]
MASQIIQLIINGVAMGFIYALVSMEYTIIYNSTGLLNFSHDKFITLGAYIFAGTFVLGIGVNPIVGVLATIITMFLFGVIVAVGIFNPLRNMPSRLFAIMGTIALGRIISEAIRLIYGATAKTVPGFITGVYRIGSIVISKATLVIIGVSILVVVILQIYMMKTKAGKAMRCVNQNKTAATLMGINVSRSIMITIAISAVICTIIGVLVVPLYSINVSMSNTIGLKGYAAGIIGGFGYLPGAIIGGLLIGVIENLSTVVIAPVYKDCVSYIIMIIVILIQPRGLRALIRRKK